MSKKVGKLYFKYGTMGSGKSHDIIKVATNYIKADKMVGVLYPSKDTRGEVGFVESRLSGKISATPILNNYDLKNKLKTMKVKNLSAIIVDESQFLSEKEVDTLHKFAINSGVHVVCYGLKNDFMSNLFPGSKRLLELSESVEEIKSICSERGCDSKSSQTLRFDSNGPVFEGNQIVVGDEEYRAVCSKHYFEYKRKYTNKK